MGFFDWLRGLFGGGGQAGKTELENGRKQLFLLEQESRSIADDLKGINRDRERYMAELDPAKSRTEQDARLVSQKLQSLDIQERGRQNRWNQVETELLQYRRALENLRNMPKVNVKQVEAEMARLGALIEQRSNDQIAVAEMRRDFESRQTAAQRSYERTTAAAAPDPYLDMWRNAKAQTVAAPQPTQPVAAPPVAEKRTEQA